MGFGQEQCSIGNVHIPGRGLGVRFFFFARSGSICPPVFFSSFFFFFCHGRLLLRLGFKKGNRRRGITLALEGARRSEIGRSSLGPDHPTALRHYLSFRHQAIWPWVNTNGIPFWGRCTTDFSLFWWGLGCSLEVRGFDPIAI